ncbi:MAG: hypothetical protein B6D37_11205 [Sphingobacteriales bacterium UTBCD1]|nr:MAG: hypothetical protein B6D37_11205 [Sphingobacteriales bacterium UTBCD1]
MNIWTFKFKFIIPAARYKKESSGIRIYGIKLFQFVKDCKRIFYISGSINNKFYQGSGSLLVSL